MAQSDESSRSLFPLVQMPRSSSARAGDGVGDARIGEHDDSMERPPLGMRRGKSIRLGKDLRFWERAPDPAGDYLSRLKKTGSRRYPYAEMDKATRGFHKSCLIDTGPSSKVYKGSIEETTLAIKQLNDTHLPHVRPRFVAEVELMSQLSHPNLARLLGWSRRCMLVYEFLPNHSLDFHLHSSSSPVPWKVRYSRIAVGLASALLYLHEGSENCIVHRNIESRNVLLDSGFNPKLGGFGVARITKDGKCEPDKQTLGTPEYMDPDCHYSSVFSKESDIYAFGVVALEIATGRRASSPSTEPKGLLQWVSELHKEGRILEAADPSLGNAFHEGEMERLLLVGLWCTHTDRRDRPTIKYIVHVLVNADVALSPSHFIGDVHHHWLDLMHAFTGGSRLSSATIEPTAGFDIGISAAYHTSEEISNPHRGDISILKGFVESLLKMMRSPEQELPRVDEALERIRKYTESLSLAVGPPLDEWNELAQLVLRTLKEREGFLEASGYREAFPVDVTSSSLGHEIEESTRAAEEDGAELERAKERLALAQQECVSLELKMTENQQALDHKRRHHIILKQYEHVLSKLSSFADRGN